MAARGRFKPDPMSSSNYAMIHNLPDDLLVGMILADSPDITQHVHLSAICHRWRASLIGRRELSCSQSMRFLDVPGRDRALLAVLSHLSSLETLSVTRLLLSPLVLDALRDLACAKSLRSLTIICTQRQQQSSSLTVDRILSALPVLQTFAVRGQELGRFLWCNSAPVLRHGVRDLAVECSVAPDPLLWSAGFAELRRLRLQLPIADDQCIRVLTDLRVAIPRLEALELSWSRDDRPLIKEAALIGLLGEARALRELSLPEWLNVSNGTFLRFISDHLAGIEALTLHIHVCTLADSVGIVPLMWLRRLRKADLIYSWEDRSTKHTEPIRLCAAPTLERLRLGLWWICENDIEIAMPGLKSLTLGLSTRCTVDCPELETLHLMGLETLTFLRPIAQLPPATDLVRGEIRCTRATAACLRALEIEDRGSFALADGVALASLEHLECNSELAKALIASAPRLAHVNLHARVHPINVLANIPALRTAVLEYNCASPSDFMSVPFVPEWPRDLASSLRRLRFCAGIMSACGEPGNLHPVLSGHPKNRHRMRYDFGNSEQKGEGGGAEGTAWACRIDIHASNLWRVTPTLAASHRRSSMLSFISITFCPDYIFRLLACAH